ncbi:MFS transporter [Promicromonospora sp. NPDC052451]|uniref:MFS transporter n=1 Tax=Promicromonospora sp. NPDC052451 TaxID=3364407 RepID=UPI0037C597E1
MLGRAFRWFWAGEAVSELGTYVTTVALQVLVVLTLGASATELGVVNAARWVPYLVLGLVLGVVVDRWRRRPVLITTDLARGVLLGAVPLLWWVGALTVPVLAGFMVVLGVASLLNDAASQSFVPRLVPRSALVRANARLDQTGAVAQASGPAVGGAVTTALGAPLAVLVDAATYLLAAFAVWRAKVPEPNPVRTATRAGGGLRHATRRLLDDVREGLRWVYRHTTLAPLALATHGWFLCNGVVTTVLAPFALVGLGLSAFQLGLALAAAGAAGLVGALFSERAGRVWGAGRTVVVARAAMVPAWSVVALAPVGDPDGAAAWLTVAVVALAPVGDPDGAAAWLTVAVVAAGQALYGLAMGLENANEMGYRQAVTPDHLQARTNTTIRSVNRAMLVVGAPAGGLLADHVGYRPALWLGVAGFTLVAALLGFSRFRTAQHPQVS